MPKEPPFLMWYDDNPKVATDAKIAAAISAYRERFRGAIPNLVLLNDEDLPLVGEIGIKVQATHTVRRNTFWIGLEREPVAV